MGAVRANGTGLARHMRTVSGRRWINAPRCQSAETIEGDAETRAVVVEGRRPPPDVPLPQARALLEFFKSRINLSHEHLHPFDRLVVIEESSLTHDQEV